VKLRQDVDVAAPASVAMAARPAHARATALECAPAEIRARCDKLARGLVEVDGKPNLKRDGYYATLLYTIAKQYQFAVRWDELNNNKDVSGNKTTMMTAGFHYLIKGKNINLKLDYLDIKQDGRKVNGVLAEKYKQAVLAAQIAF
jgi:hypothetical protein